MSATSSIEWTDRTWNPVRGCSIVSPGCVNCYAMKFAHRFSGKGKPYEGLTKQTAAGPQWTGRAAEVVSALNEPLSWRQPVRIFVNSMSDLFHDDVSDEFILNVFTVMAVARRHTFQILTKRPERMRDLVSSWRADDIYLYWHGYSGGPAEIESWPLPNVWLGTSCEDQQRADERIPLLLQTPAAVRFVSAEPLLGPIDLEAVPLPGGAEKWYGLRGVAQPLSEKDTEADDWKYWTRKQAKLDWAIVGGESGHGSRPCDVSWIRSIVQQCQSARVPVFVKQIGACPTDETAPIRDFVDALAAAGAFVKDSKGGDPSEWPADLRVRQFPAEARS